MQVLACPAALSTRSRAFWEKPAGQSKAGMPGSVATWQRPPAQDSLHRKALSMCCRNQVTCMVDTTTSTLPADSKQRLPKDLPPSDREQGHEIVLYHRCSRKAGLSVASFEFVIMVLFAVSLPVALWRKHRQTRGRFLAA